MSKDLTGTIAIVTGASSGIGSATARALAKKNATVVLIARRKIRLDTLVSEIKNEGGKAVAIECDISNRQNAENAVADVIRQFGQIDILVNNAGVMHLGTVEETSIDGWEQMIDLNQKGLLYMTRAALPYLKLSAINSNRKVADIVNISSIAGRKASATFAVYNMTKFGLNGFSEALRQELTDSHIRVGLIEPGAVKTELNDHHQGNIKEQIDTLFASIESLNPEDIADGIVYMVTRPAHAAVAEMLILPTEQK